VIKYNNLVKLTRTFIYLQTYAGVYILQHTMVFGRRVGGYGCRRGKILKINLEAEEGKWEKLKG